MLLTYISIENLIKIIVKDFVRAYKSELEVFPEFELHYAYIWNKYTTSTVTCEVTTKCDCLITIPTKMIIEVLQPEM